MHLISTLFHSVKAFKPILSDKRYLSFDPFRPTFHYIVISMARSFLTTIGTGFTHTFLRGCPLKISGTKVLLLPLIINRLSLKSTGPRCFLKMRPACQESRKCNPGQKEPLLTDRMFLLFIFYLFPISSC